MHINYMNAFYGLLVDTLPLGKVVGNGGITILDQTIGSGLKWLLSTAGRPSAGQSVLLVCIAPFCNRDRRAYLYTEPIAKPAVTAEPRRAFGLGFEFPITMAPPLANGHAPTQTTSPPSNILTQTRSVPASSPSRVPQRLPKLSLSNYAAPSVSPISPGPRPSRSPLNSPSLSSASAPNPFEVSLVPKDEHGPKPVSPSVMPGMQTIIGGQPATASFSEPRSRGIALQWPWGLRSKPDSPPGSGSSSESSTLSLPHSPRNGSPLSATPVNSNSGSPQSGSGTSSPKKSLVSDSDQLYNAFVRQWCFAQSPQPGPGHNGFAATDGFSESVLVG